MRRRLRPSGIGQHLNMWKSKCFVKDFNTLATLLTEIVKKSIVFKCDDKHKDAFKLLN
jgi:hypothetical protein